MLLYWRRMLKAIELLFVVLTRRLAVPSWFFSTDDSLKTKTDIQYSIYIRR